MWVVYYSSKGSDGLSLVFISIYPKKALKHFCLLGRIETSHSLYACTIGLLLEHPQICIN